MLQKNEPELVLTSDGELSFDAPIEKHPHLNRVFNFSDEELYINQHGRITETQTRNIAQSLGNRSLPIPLRWVFASTTLVWLLILGAQDSISTGSFIAFIFYLIVSVGFMVAAYVNFRRIASKETQTGIWRIKGKLQKPKYGMRVKIGEEEFNVTQRQHAALMEGETYTVYFTRPSRIILSIEVADAPKK